MQILARLYINSSGLYREFNKRSEAFVEELVRDMESAKTEIVREPSNVFCFEISSLIFYPKLIEHNFFDSLEKRKVA